MLFSRRAGPYHPDQLNEGEDPCAKLVERIENAIANEREATIQWRTSPREERPMPRVIADSGEENNAETRLIHPQQQLGFGIPLQSLFP